MAAAAHQLSGALSAEVAGAVQAAAATSRNGAGAAKSPPQQSAADAIRQAAESDWWRCLLSGKVMQDPVLYGDGGHSLEREALEQWRVANP